jgi:hypothetical protein
MKYVLSLDNTGTGNDVERSDSDDSCATEYVSPNMNEAKKRKIQNDNSNEKWSLIGSGSTEESLINKIVDLVAQKFKSSEDTIGRGVDLSPPTADLVSTSSSAPLPFNNTIVKNDDNDRFGNFL